MREKILTGKMYCLLEDANSNTECVNICTWYALDMYIHDLHLAVQIYYTCTDALTPIMPYACIRSCSISLLLMRSVSCRGIPHGGRVPGPCQVPSMTLSFKEEAIVGAEEGANPLCWETEVDECLEDIHRLTGSLPGGYTRQTGHTMMMVTIMSCYYK